MRSSGHETFACRDTWIPKAVSSLGENPRLFSNDAEAMVRLGLGKNMVNALRFWIQIMGVAAATDRARRELAITPFGRALFDNTNGRDPYMEDLQTLWLLHWNLASHDNPLLAWDHLLFRHPNSDILRSTVVDEMLARTKEKNMRATRGTLNQHFDVFLHTYLPTRGRKGEVLEDNLDCPLTELDLLRCTGEKILDGGKREPVYAFRFEEKPEISPGLFMYCLHRFWSDSHSEEKTLSLRQIANDVRSPGKIFKLPEAALRARLETIERDSNGYFIYVESVALQQVQRSSQQVPDFLPAIYGEDL